MQFSLSCLGSQPLPRLLLPFPLLDWFVCAAGVLHTLPGGFLLQDAVARQDAAVCQELPTRWHATHLNVTGNAFCSYALRARLMTDRWTDGRTDLESDEPTDGRRHWRVLERHCRQPPCVMHSLWSVKFACFSGIKIQNQSQNFPYAFPLLLLWSP